MRQLVALSQFEAKALTLPEGEIFSRKKRDKQWQHQQQQETSELEPPWMSRQQQCRSEDLGGRGNRGGVPTPGLPATDATIICGLEVDTKVNEIIWKDDATLEEANHSSHKSSGIHLRI
jgi:hypothetical protein